MLRTRIEVTVVPKTFTYIHQKELPLDPLLKNILMTMFEHGIDYEDVPTQIGLKGDLNLFLRRRFMESFKDVEDKTHKSIELKKMYENDIYYVKIQVDEKYQSYPEFGLVVYRGNTIQEKSISKVILNKADKDNAKFNLVSSNIIEHKEKILDINVESKLTNIKKGKALDQKVSFNEEVIEKIQDEINTKQATIHIADSYAKKLENINLLTKFDLKDLISKSDISYKELECGNIIAIKIRRDNIIVSRAYLTNDNIYTYVTDNISITTIKGDEDFIKMISLAINKGNNKVIRSLPKELIIHMLSIDDNDVNDAISSVLKIRQSLLNREFVLSILQLDHFSKFKIYLGGDDFFKLFKKLSNSERAKFVTIMDDSVIKSVNEPKLIKLLINSGFETYISDTQRAIYDDFITSLKKRFSHYNETIGGITSSGLREGSKSLPKKTQQKIGYSKRVGKWLNDNIGHNKNVSMETLDDGAIKKAESILDIANKYIEYMRTKNE